MSHCSNIRLMNDCFFKYCILQFLTTTVFTVGGMSISSAVSKRFCFFLLNRLADVEFMLWFEFCDVHLQENVLITHGSTATGIFQIVTYCVMGTIIENSVRTSSWDLLLTATINLLLFINFKFAEPTNLWRPVWARMVSIARETPTHLSSACV